MNSVLPSGGSEDNKIPVTLANCSHLLKFYDNDEDLFGMLEEIVTSGLEAHEPCVVIASNEHRGVLRSRLGGRGIDVDSAIRDRRFLDVDAHAILDRVMQDRLLDPERLETVVKNEIIMPFAESGRQVRTFGELAPILWDRGNPAASVKLERVWDELMPEKGLDVFCAYPSSVCFGDSAELIDQIHAAHTGLIGNDPRKRGTVKPLKMLFSLPLPGDSEGSMFNTQNSPDPIIPVLYRLEAVTTATFDGVGYSYELTGELAEKRNSGSIKDTFHNSPTDPYAPWGTSMKIDAVILYDPKPGSDQ
jgi:hypothetical protein